MISEKFFRNIMLSVGLIASVASHSVLAESTGYRTEGQASPRSWLPYTSFGYVGLNLGVPHFQAPCYGPFSCDDPQIAGKLYTGGLFSKAIGVELGYINVGRAVRNGGDVSAQGANVSLVGNVPLGDVLNVFAKVGGTYGWTKTNVSPLFLSLENGEKDGFGVSYGAGIAIDATPQIQLLVEWDRHQFNFKNGASDVELFSLGIKYKF